MLDLSEVFGDAFRLVVSFDTDLIEIMGMSLSVTLGAVMIACLIGFPLGAALALWRFLGRDLTVLLVNALMGLPPVVVGLVLYLLFSASGPFGVLELLYSPAIMVVAQIILVTPIVAALTLQVISDLHAEYDETLRSMGISRHMTVRTLLWDARHSLLTAALAGFGRANAEVGAVMIVGGNINHVTRMMTTSIALETSRGELSLALALGMILIALTIAVNAALMTARSGMDHFANALPQPKDY